MRTILQTCSLKEIRMRLGKLGLLLVILSSSTLAFSHTTKEDIKFFFGQSTGETCRDAEMVYDALTNVRIRDLGNFNYDITGSIPDFPRVFVDLIHVEKTGLSADYTCSYGRY